MHATEGISAAYLNFWRAVLGAGALAVGEREEGSLRRSLRIMDLIQEGRSTPKGEPLQRRIPVIFRWHFSPFLLALLVEGY